MHSIRLTFLAFGVAATLAAQSPAPTVQSSLRLGVFRVLLKEVALKPRSAGTAFLIDRERGLLLTAQHNVNEHTQLPDGRLRIGAAILVNGQTGRNPPLLAGEFTAKVLASGLDPENVALLPADFGDPADVGDWALLQVGAGDIPLIECFEDIVLDPLISLESLPGYVGSNRLFSPGFPGMDSETEAQKVGYTAANVSLRTSTTVNGLIEINCESGGFARGQSGAPVLTLDGRLLSVVIETEPVQGQREYSRTIPAAVITPIVARRVPRSERIERLASFFDALRARQFRTRQALLDALAPGGQTGLWLQYVSAYASMQRLRGHEQFQALELLDGYEPALQKQLTDYLFCDFFLPRAALVTLLRNRPLEKAMTSSRASISKGGSDDDAPESPSEFLIAVANYAADNNLMARLVQQGYSPTQLTKFLVDCQLVQPATPVRDLRLASLDRFAAKDSNTAIGYAGSTARRSIDRMIEDAAIASYNYRTILGDHVKVKAHNGVVTLTGTVQDKDDRNLAVGTVENLPGVVSVNNEIKVEPAFPEKSDAWMAVRIRSRLLVKANVSAATTTVEVQDGVVTLGGTADNLAQKELTEVYAREIDWVKSVKNHIVVGDQPATGETIGEKIDDASITGQVKFALLNHKSTSALKTKITTNNGVIVITGEANSDAEKSFVSKLAQDVRGVKSVSNQMIVKS